MVAGALLFTGVVHAGDVPVVFKEIREGADPSPREAYQSAWIAEVDTAAFKDQPTRIRLNLPGEEVADIERVSWRPMEGFITLTDDNMNDYTIADPNAPPEAFSWHWYGRGSGWTVSLSLTRGVIAGRATSNGHRYAIEPRYRELGLAQLGLVNGSYWRDHPVEDPGQRLPQATFPLPPSAPPPSGDLLDALVAFKTSAGPRGSWDANCAAPLDLSAYHNVDVLVMYTPEVLAHYAALGTNIEAAIAAKVNDANKALENSRIDHVRYVLAGVEPVPATGFNYDAQDIEVGLKTLSGVSVPPGGKECDYQGNSAVIARRNALHADVVALARKPSTPGDISCGIANVQRVDLFSQCSGEPGPEWEKYAYFVFNPVCGTADRLNFAHELGHILGMDHDPNNAPYDGNFMQSSCPWSFGHRARASSGGATYPFRTVMSYWNSVTPNGLTGPPPCTSSTDCPQIDAYSNWSLEWAGVPLSYQSYPTVPNALRIGVPTASWMGPASHAYDTLQRIGPIVAAFRARPDAIFTHGFEP